MQANTWPTGEGGAVLASVLGIGAAVLVLGVLVGATAHLPLIGSDRGALIALVVVGMTMCALGGIGRAQATVGWAHPVTILGAALGTAVIVLVGAVLVGRGAPLVAVAAALPGGPVLADSPERAALVLIAALMAVKWLLATLLLRAPAALGG
jgi:hypothetical protein